MVIFKSIFKITDELAFKNKKKERKKSIRALNPCYQDQDLFVFFFTEYLRDHFSDSP